LYQTRYCSRLVNRKYGIECLVTLDTSSGDHIEIRACSAETYRDELFYFMDDLYTFISDIICRNSKFPETNVNLEKHYMYMKPIEVFSQAENNLVNTNLGLIDVVAIFSPKNIIEMQLENKKKTIISKTNEEVSFSHLILLLRNKVYSIVLLG
jgi:hypothetical protein